MFRFVSKLLSGRSSVTPPCEIPQVQAPLEVPSYP
jgi:hypothetical protein